MDNYKNDGQNNLDSRDLRDNFKNIREFMEAEDYDAKAEDEKQIQNSRDLRDNFKNIRNIQKNR